MNVMLNKILDYIKKEFSLMVVGGAVYVIIELLWRGRSHYTMFFVGGICFCLIGLLNEFYTFKMYMEVQALISSIIITVVEFISGYIINIKCGLNVWDYSNLPLNIMGQICLLFSVLWFFLSFFAIFFDDYLRYLLFDEPVEKYQWFIHKIFVKKKSSK